MNLKKCLAVVLSMTLLLTCLISGMSLNTTAAPSQEAAKTALEAAWAALESKHEVVFGNFYDKETGSWGATALSPEVVDGITYVTPSANTKDPNFIVMGPLTAARIDVGQPEVTVDIDDYSKLYFNYAASGSTRFEIGYYFTQTYDKDGAPATKMNTAVQVVNLAATDGKKGQFDLLKWMNENKDDKDIPYANYYNGVGKGDGSKIGDIFNPLLSRIHTKDDKTLDAISYVYGSKKIDVPRKETLAELVKAAEAFDTTTVVDATAFNKALDNAIEALLADDTTAVPYLTDKWDAMSQTEVLFDVALWKAGSSGSWSVKADANSKNETINGESIPVTEFTQNGGIILAASGTTSEKNPKTVYDVDNYSAIYVYYKATGTVTLQLGYGVNGSNKGADPYGSQLGNTNGEYARYDMLDKMTGKANFDMSSDSKYGFSRFHISANPNNITGLSAVYGDKPFTVPTATTLADLVEKADAEDLTKYTDNAAKTDFIAAVKAAKAVLFADVDFAKTAIKEAWAEITAKPVALYDHFYDKSTGSWGADHCATETRIIDGNEVTFAINKPLSNGNFIIKSLGFSASDVGKGQNDITKADGWTELYCYYNTPTALTGVLGSRTDDGVVGNHNTDNSETNNITLNATEGAIKLDILAGLANNKGFNTMGKYFTRLHFSGANANLIEISYIYGVKDVDFDNAFGDAFSGGVANGSWTLFQWIKAYYETDFSAYNTEALDAAVEAVCAANPKYAAFKDVLPYANNIYTVQNLQGFKAGGSDSTGTTVAPLTEATTSTDAEGNPVDVPMCDDYDFTTMYKVDFTGKGFDKLGTKDHKEMSYLQQTQHNDYKLEYNTARGLYLSYFVPSSVTGTVKIAVHPRGDVNGVDTTQDTNYIKVIELTERDKWVQLTADDLLVDSIKADFTKINNLKNNIIVDLCAEDGAAAEIFLSYLVWGGAKKTYNATTLADFAEEINSVNTATTDAGERIASRSDFNSYRTAFNKALNPDFRISMDAIYLAKDEKLNKDEKVYYYDKGDGTLATGYRTFAKYICPVGENGEADPTKIVVEGKEYDIVSRSLMLTRDDQDNFNDLSASTVTDKTINTVDTPEELAKYWDINPIDDKTAEVTFSYKMINVSRDNAENRIHKSRSLIKYTDGLGNEVSVYSDVYNHGKIKDLYKPENGAWFPEV